MTSRLEMAVRRAHEGILRCASLFVPTSRRSDWLEEWQGELWYVLRECSPKNQRSSPVNERSHCILPGGVPGCILAPEAIMAKATVAFANLRVARVLPSALNWCILRGLGIRSLLTSSRCWNVED